MAIVGVKDGVRVARPGVLVAWKGVGVGVMVWMGSTSSAVGEAFSGVGVDALKGGSVGLSDASITAVAGRPSSVSFASIVKAIMVGRYSVCTRVGASGTRRLLHPVRSIATSAHSIVQKP